MKNKDTRKLRPDTQEYIRQRAVKLRESGLNLFEVADILGVHYTSVSRWHTAYQENGAQAIQARKRGPKVGQHRTLKDEEGIRSIITAHTPDEVGLPYGCGPRKRCRPSFKSAPDWKCPFVPSVNT